MKTRVRELVEQGDRLFSKRSPLLSYWQTLAEQFYPIRADFTTKFSPGEEFASHLMNGRPVLAHRDLGNALSSMLRPRGQKWFHARTPEEKINEDAGAKQWLDAQGDIMTRMMYDPRAQFIRATKEGDAGFILCGQWPLTVEPNRDQNGVSYRSWHLKDVAWCENYDLVIDVIHSNWELEARQLVKLFPKTVAKAVERCLKDEPYKEIKCRRIVMPADEYDYNDPSKKPRKEFPFISIYVDCENDTILEEVPIYQNPWVIPRWVTVTGSQYAHSPAAYVALPDARMLQQISLTLLEAGQKAVDPPLKATAEAIQGGVNTFAGGITWVDAEYDEKIGKALEPVMDAPPGLNWGDQREAIIEQRINEAFFLNAVQVPYPEKDMTATEFRFRVEEYVRRALPLFEPIEVEYNGGLCEKTFNIGMRMGAFGSLWDMPQILRGQDVRFTFESPLQAATERAKSQAFMEAANLLATGAQIDPTLVHDFDASKAFRDALSGVAPAKWVRKEEEAEQLKAQAAQQAMLEKAAAQLGAGAEIAGQVGVAGQELAAAGMIPGGGGGGGESAPAAASMVAPQASAPSAAPIVVHSSGDKEALMSLADAISGLKEAYLAPTELVRDKSGRPTGSKKVMQKEEA